MLKTLFSAIWSLLSAFWEIALVRWFCYFYVVFAAFSIWARKHYNNPYKNKMYIGNPGSGKTTLEVREIYYATHGYSKKVDYIPENIYSNTPVDNDAIPGVKYYENKNFGLWLKDNSIIFMDEVNVSGFDNRDWATTTYETVKWLSMHRHNKAAGRFYAQDADVEKKLLKVMDEIYLVNKFLYVFVVVRKVNKTLSIQKSEGSNAGSEIVSQLELEPLFSIFPIPHFNVEIAFIPKWAKYYDTYSRPENVQYMPYTVYEDGVPKKYMSTPPWVDDSMKTVFTERDIKGMPEKFEEEVIRKYKKDKFAAQYKKEQDALERSSSDVR